MEHTLKWNWSWSVCHSKYAIVYPQILCSYVGAADDTSLRQYSLKRESLTQLYHYLSVFFNSGTTGIKTMIIAGIIIFTSICQAKMQTVNLQWHLHLREFILGKPQSCLFLSLGAISILAEILTYKDLVFFLWLPTRHWNLNTFTQLTLAHCMTVRVYVWVFVGMCQIPTHDVWVFVGMCDTCP